MTINPIQSSFSVNDVQVLKEQSVLQTGKSDVSAFGTEIVQDENVNFKKNPFNLYGKNIENFEKFKGKDKNDALNATNKAAANINNQYNKLKQDFPDINVEFEEPPNPKDYGKKREGFQSYMQALERWEKTCSDAINQARKEQEALAAKNKKNNSANPAPPKKDPTTNNKQPQDTNAPPKTASKTPNKPKTPEPVKDAEKTPTDKDLQDLIKNELSKDKKGIEILDINEFVKRQQESEPPKPPEFGDKVWRQGSRPFTQTQIKDILKDE